MSILNITTKHFFIICCLFFIVAFSFSGFSNEIIKIAETNHSEASAYNNGRRIVRTSNDRLVIVYQDSLNKKPIVMWTYSNDGVIWPSPEILAYGSFPSLTIAENDWIYAVWSLDNEKGISITYMKENTLSWENGNLPRNIIMEGSFYNKFPVVEITTNAVHVVWQSKLENDVTNNIFYQRFDRTLSDTLSSIVCLSVDSCNSIFPTIAGDLEFNVDLLYVFWTDFALSQNKSQINYCVIDETKGLINLFISQPKVTPFILKSHPSISVRNYMNMDGSKGSDIMISYVTEDSSRFLTSMVFIDSTVFFVAGTDTIKTSQHPMPVVDDIYMLSCAIVWQNDNSIYYGQNIDGSFVTLPPIPVSESNEICKNPNLCYKTFRFDVFDAIWTEGDHPPYKLMYRRMQKRQKPLSVKKIYNKNQFIISYQLLPNYPNPFNNSTTIPIFLTSKITVEILIFDINFKRIKQLYSGKLNSGLHKFIWNANNECNLAVPSGIYFIRASSPKFILNRKILLVK